MGPCRRLLLIGPIVAMISTAALAGRGLQTGDAAPPAVLAAADGVPTDLLSHGRVHLLLFWASWSPRSLSALAYLRELPARYPGDRLGIAAVNADHQRMDDQRLRDAAAALREAGYDGPSAIDPSLEVYNAFGIIALPTFVVVGATGRVEGFVAGFHDTAPEEVEEVLDRLLSRTTSHVSGEPRPVPPAPVPRGGADVLLAEGREAWRMGNSDDAISSFGEAVGRDPGSVEAAVTLARALRRAGMTAEADAAVARLRDLPLAHPAEIVLAASLLLDEKRAADAKEALDGAVRLWPGDGVLAALQLAARIAAGGTPSDEEIAPVVGASQELPGDVAFRLGSALAGVRPREAAAVLRGAIEGMPAAVGR